jgi:hypothetical protein
MRLIALLIAIAGALMAFGYPAWIDLGSGAEIGRYSVSVRPGATPSGPTLALSPADAPVGIFLTVSAPDVSPKPAEGGATATFELVLSRGEAEIERAEAGFRFTYPANDQALRPAQPRQKQLVLLVDPPEPGTYRISVARSDDDAFTLESAVLSVNRKAIVPDERIAPAGFLLLVLGGVGFVVLRRGRRQKTEPRPPRSHKWGR